MQSAIQPYDRCWVGVYKIDKRETQTIHAFVYNQWVQFI